VKILGLVVAFAFSLAGQTVEPEMTADRPGFRNSTHLVGPGVMQVENGLDLSSDHTVAMEPEFRIGALRWLELRVSSRNVVLRSSPGSGLAGTSDLQPGIKFPVFNRILGTRVVAIVKSTVPSGHASQTTGGYEPGAELIWEHKLTDDFSFAGTWNLTRLKQERFVWQRAASVSANNDFGDRLKTFAEVYVVSPKELGAGNQWALDAGVQRVIGNFVMVDMAAGHSVHGPSDWFVTVGFSVRTRIPRATARGTPVRLGSCR
jgi:Putative MetA-pathway of phenol degradation